MCNNSGETEEDKASVYNLFRSIVLCCVSSKLMLNLKSSAVSLHHHKGALNSIIHNNCFSYVSDFPQTWLKMKSIRWGTHKYFQGNWNIIRISCYISTHTHISLPWELQFHPLKMSFSNIPHQRHKWPKTKWNTIHHFVAQFFLFFKKAWFVLFQPLAFSL